MVMYYLFGFILFGRGTAAGDPPKIAWSDDFHGSGVNSLFMPVSTDMVRIWDKVFSSLSLGDSFSGSS
jgi:hypothetical protein